MSYMMQQFYVKIELSHSTEGLQKHWTTICFFFIQCLDYLPKDRTAAAPADFIGIFSHVNMAFIGLAHSHTLSLFMGF